MIIQLIGSGEPLQDLHTLVEKALKELMLDDAVSVNLSDDAAMKLELGITENPAFAIEEESINFRDMIFQGEIPEYEEIKSMFISILWDDDEWMNGCWSCSSAGGCSDCGSSDWCCSA